MIYVIADDLTGANDTGVQFSKKGYKTVVVVPDRSLCAFDKSQIDVLVIDTETRHLDSKGARKSIKNILETLDFGEGDIVYKKIDSTLRGNIGIEIDEIMKSLKRNICIFVPSFPSYKRITVGGSLLIQGKSLVKSEYFNDNLRKNEKSHILVLLKSQTDLPISRIDLKDVIKGQEAILQSLKKNLQDRNKIVVIDAVNEEHLSEIYDSSLKLNGSILYAGSAGLASQFAVIDYQETGKAKEFNFESEKSNGAVLIISGSRSATTESQILYLKKMTNIFELNIDIEEVLYKRQKILEKYVKDSIQILTKEYCLIIRAIPLFNREMFLKNFIVNKRVNFRELEVTIQEFFGEVVAKVYKKYAFENLILIGGDTAFGVCSKMGICTLNILDELLPGIPVSFSSLNKYAKLKIVTKAGGFGEEDTLYKLIDMLINNKMKSKLLKS
ncbi:MAG: hypothetical protein A7315_02420 [Candidatus Altiarchaeales archaeon WOR_SM1_79]|nr:MAG: hypothetical protein A7315_02420 [Candidatus Altiarchaeales archaeon WOR_SM1_79]